MTKQITTGQDSFLDIVANLVGILIILVVVVGAQASHQLQSIEPEPQRTGELAALSLKVSTASHTVAKLRSDNEQLESQINQENQLAAALTSQRHRMLVELMLLEQETEQKTRKYHAKLASVDQQLKADQIKRAAFESEKRSLEQQLAELETEQGALQASQPLPQATETIDHYPNPIAKTVFDEEVHFRLANGQLSYVPMDELIAVMKSEWKLKAEKLANAPRTLETVGPIDGYRLQYELGAETVVEKTEFGVLQRRSVEFQRFVIVPQPSLQSESVQAALQPGSEFQQRLAAKVPARTTVSIWVYPDGFQNHAILKNWLHEHGFQMASWPLVEGKQISGGPNGFKTSAQ